MVLNILADLFVTLLIYLTFPLIYVTKNGRVHKKKATKLALINAVVGCIIACLFRAFVTGGEMVFNSFLPALLYFWIGQSILTDKFAKDESQKEDYSICSNCGNKIFANEKTCSGCGGEIVEDNTESINSSPMIDRVSKQNKKTISILQKVVVSLFVVVVLFAIIYPISVNGDIEKELPSFEDRHTAVKLSALYSGDDAFCVESGSLIHVYIVEDNGDITLYAFNKNGSRYSSNGSERVGYATLNELKEYFDSNFHLGKPKTKDVKDYVLPVGIIVPSILVISIVIMCVCIHRIATEDLFRLFKTDSELKKLRSQYKEDQIPKSYYNKARREYYSSNVLKQNRFFSIFKFLY